MAIPRMRVDGRVAEFTVASDLLRKGFLTFSPNMDNTECDLVVEINSKLYKVQVKSAHSDGNKIRLDLTRSSAKKRFYDKSDFDLLAICDSSTGLVAYLVWRNLPHKRSLTLRFTETDNSNGFVKENGRMFFDDYLELPIEQLEKLKEDE